MSNRPATQLADTYTVVLRLSGIAQETSDLGHSFDTHDALNGEVGLVRERARKVVRAQLLRGDEGVRDQEPGPLIKQAKL